jgi:hypothetical protein
MRFGNSRNYFGLASNTSHSITLNSATGKPFHAAAPGGSPARLVARARVSAATNSSLPTCSKVTNYHVETAASAIQASAKRGAIFPHAAIWQVPIRENNTLETVQASAKRPAPPASLSKHCRLL